MPLPTDHTTATIYMNNKNKHEDRDAHQEQKCKGVIIRSLHTSTTVNQCKVPLDSVCYRQFANYCVHSVSIIKYVANFCYLSQS